MLEETDIIDLTYKEDDGSPVLCIVDAGFTEDPEERLDYLEEKLHNYAYFIDCPAFAEDYPDAEQRARVAIEVLYSVPPTPQMEGIPSVRLPKSGTEIPVRHKEGPPL